MTTQPTALRLADELMDGMSDENWSQLNADAANELRRLHDLLGKANALARIRAKRLQALETDPAYDYCHRLAIMLECMALNADKNFDAACALLDEYNAARDKWSETQGQPYVSPFGKD